MDFEGPKFTALTVEMMDLKDAIMQEFVLNWPAESTEEAKALYLRISEFLLQQNFYRECLEALESKPVRPQWKDLPTFFPPDIVSFRAGIVRQIINNVPNRRKGYEEKRRYLQYSYELASGVCIADAIGDIRDLMTEWRFPNTCIQLIEAQASVRLIEALHAKLLEYYPWEAPEANRVNFLTFAKEFLSNRFLHRFVFPSAIPIRSEMGAVALTPRMESFQQEVEKAVSVYYPKDQNIFIRAQYLVLARTLLTYDFYDEFLQKMPAENQRNCADIKSWIDRDYQVFQQIRETVFRILPRSMFK